MRTTTFLLLAIFLNFQLSAFGEDKEFVNTYVENNFYTYDGEWLNVNVRLRGMKKDYTDLDLTVETTVPLGDFEPASDDPSYSITKIKTNSYKIHFVLK